MKNARRLPALLLVLALLFSLAACQPEQQTVAPPASSETEESIIGRWKDSYGLTEMEFHEDGSMKIEALDIGSFDGSYKINDNKLTIEYSIIIKTVRETYLYKLKDGILYLDEKEFTRKNV